MRSAGGYKYLLHPCSLIGLILIVTLIALDTAAPLGFATETIMKGKSCYIATASLLLALIAIFLGYKQWEHKTRQLKTLHVQLAQGTAQQLNVLQMESREATALFKQSKLTKASNTSGDEYVKVLIFNKRDISRLLALLSQILKSLQQAIKTSDAITAEINNAVISKNDKK
ncbi:MAG: hypothetical protein JSS50_04995 [Proteobacteria bacterium]|nr:hypothetical protein [Pseudomonadota bacterium]